MIIRDTYALYVCACMCVLDTYLWTRCETNQRLDRHQEGGICHCKRTETRGGQPRARALTSGPSKPLPASPSAVYGAAVVLVENVTSAEHQNCIRHVTVQTQFPVRAPETRRRQTVAEACSPPQRDKTMGRGMCMNERDIADVLTACSHSFST